jgi:hypothetical protein
MAIHAELKVFLAMPLWQAETSSFGLHNEEERTADVYTQASDPRLYRLICSSVRKLTDQHMHPIGLRSTRDACKPRNPKKPHPKEIPGYAASR